MTGKNHSLKTARIKDVAELDPETLGESTDPGFTFKYIDLSSVKGGRISDQVESMTFATAPGRARKLIKEGDVLLGMVRPYLKPFAKVQCTLNGHVASTGFAVIRAKPGISDSEYLYQAIWSDGISKQIHQMVTGSNYPALSVGDVKDLKIPLPPLAEQRKIAEILRTWDEAIETAEAELKAKQERKRWLVSQLLSTQVSGKTYRLGDLFERVVRRNTSGCTMSLTISASAGLIDQREIFSRKITSVENDNYFLVKRGEYAYNRSHSIGNPYGVIRRLVRYQEGIVSPIYLVFKCISQDVDERYADILFEGGGLNRQLRKIAQEGARAHGLLNVTAEDFFSMKVSLPDLTKQNRDSEMMSEVSQEITLKEMHVESLRTQKRGLMQKILTGVIRIAA